MDVLSGLLGDLRAHRRLSPVELLLLLPALLLALWSLGTWIVYFWLTVEARRGPISPERRSGRPPTAIVAFSNAR